VFFGFLRFHGGRASRRAAISVPCSMGHRLRFRAVAGI
jgi:hypothetical protein